MMAEGSRLTVTIDRAVCIGAGDCVRRAPGAFAFDEQGVATVADLAAADAETLRAAERSCPSGAISLSEATDAFLASSASIEVVKITALENGPLLVETPGSVRVTRGGQEETLTGNVVALCRCGQSSNKPFCDGSHKTAEIGLPGAELVFGSS
jgi:CDGSH-type Zn-finger protein/ferredoxin